MYRLSIAAYTSDDASADALHAAMADISLVRSTLEAHPGGLDAALARYSAGEDTPELLVVQSNGSEAELRSGLDALSGIVSPGTQVVVVGTVDSIDFYRAIIDLGVGQYVLAPLTPAGFLRAVKDVFGGERSTVRGRTIAVVGSKGGIGASTISHNVAWCLADMFHKPVSLIDLDLHFGTAGIDYNHEPRFGLRDALQQTVGGETTLDESFLERLFSKESDTLWLLASAPSMQDSTSILSSETLEAVLDGVARMSDYTVLDVPHVWNTAMFSALLLADEVLVVAEPSLQGLRNTQLMFEAIGPSKPQGTFLRYVINNSGLDRNSEIGAKDFSEAVGSSPVLTLPWNPVAFRGAGIQGKMVSENKRDKKIAAPFMELARSVSGTVVPVAVKPKPKSQGLLSGLLGKKSTPPK
jgi:pilus assembly protein CpaE